MSRTQILVTIIAALISGIISVIISTLSYKRYEKRKRKLDLLKNIIAYRYVLTNNKTSDEEKKEFFSSLNAVFVIFNDNPKVIVSLTKYHEEITQVNKNKDNLISLIKAMCQAVNIDNSVVNDSFFEIPFIPKKTAN